jgi:integrase
MANVDLLSAAKVKSLKAPGDYLDGRGLYLQVRSETSKSWLLKFSMDKRAREMGLGSAFDFTLAEAREQRDELRKLIKRGIDPLEQRKAEKQAKKVEAAKAITFRAAATRLIASKRKGWKNAKHADQWTATLETYAYPVIGELPVQAVDTGLVMKILDPIWSTKTETASRVRGRIESVIEGAKAFGEYVGENPARWKGNLDATLPKPRDVHVVKNHPALPYAQLPAFLLDLRARDGIAAAAVEFGILTAARPGNVVNARWDEINRTATIEDIEHSVPVWTIAGEHMKMGDEGDEEHKIPLSAAALAVLDRMEKIRSGEFIFFSTDRGLALSDAATGALIDRMNAANIAAGRPKWIDPKSKKAKKDVVPHGFRSTFRTWAGNKTNFQREVIEKALAHQVGDETERAYDRGDLFEKRLKLMDAWAAFATSDPARSADVLPFAPIATTN